VVPLLEILYVGLTIVVGAISTVWFTFGGTLDLRKLFKRLKTLQVNANDDARVIGHMNADDYVALQNKQAGEADDKASEPDHRP
jgi:hypothetical protein